MLPTVSTAEIDQKPITFHEEFMRGIGVRPVNDIPNSRENEQEEIIDVLNDSHSSKSRPQECKICGKILSSTSSYYVHMKLHSGQKPFQCTMCDISFCRKPYLEVHMRTHTGEKPFECEYCLKRFTQKSSLNTHKRSHTGQKPYSCDICDKKFAVKSYVTAHRWTHIGAQNMNCEVCKMTFPSKNQFAAHIKTHMVSNNHVCNVCGRSFMRDSYLLRHQIRAHKSVQPTNHTSLAANYQFHFLNGMSQTPSSSDDSTTSSILSLNDHKNIFQVERREPLMPTELTVPTVRNFHDSCTQTNEIEKEKMTDLNCVKK